MSWAQILSDRSHDDFMFPLSTIWKVGDPKYLWDMTNIHADWRSKGHHKATHGYGAVAKVHIDWDPNPYTGMFQPGQAQHCIARMANAAPPGGLAMGSYGPNLALKCFRDFAESANMQFIWQVDGYAVIPSGSQYSCSFFEAPLCNHNPLRDNINMPLKSGFIDKFQKIDSHSMALGVSQMAEHTQEGKAVEKPNFPFALVLKPTEKNKRAPCKWNEPVSQLLALDIDTLYDIYAVDNPGSSYANPPKPVKIGSMKMDTRFTTSMFADTQLFFRHTFFAEELNLMKKIDPARAAKWSAYMNDRNNYKNEGANIYWSQLPGGREEMEALAKQVQMLESDFAVNQTAEVIV